MSDWQATAVNGTAATVQDDYQIDGDTISIALTAGEMTLGVALGVAATLTLTLSALAGWLAGRKIGA